MNKNQWLIAAIVIAAVVLGFYVYKIKYRGSTPAGQEAQQSASPTPTALPSRTPIPTPTPSNPLGNVKTNPFNGVKFNPFNY